MDFLQNRMIFPFRSIVILFMFSSFSLWSAQTILLKDGTSIKGKVTVQNEKIITIRMENGSVQTLSKNGVLKVIYKDVSEEEAKQIRKKEEAKTREFKSTGDKKKIKKDTILSKSEIRNFRTRSRWDLIWRSAVLPGWGHYKINHKKIGIFYGALFWGGIVLTVLSTEEIERKKSEYKDAALVGQISENLLIREAILNGKRSEYKKSVDEYENIVTGTVLIYFIQLTHSYFTGVNWEKEKIVAPGGAILRKGIQLDSMRETNFLNSKMTDWRAEVRYNWFF
ncbi:LA_0442/LA_0875 N-terminal domain-containing protein [Leptospira weilii]|uniref:LA_0442/LA_0875 N-terminal domain-containing protein n=1 Tax=Leptospira weilii TaxID=28184 RepID=UPI00115A5714|nr:hypothetical protein [Leptospira weilii]QDK23180.1 hypothetical protein FHG67_10980 [Leptospira weilii]